MENLMSNFVVDFVLFLSNALMPVECTTPPQSAPLLKDVYTGKFRSSQHSLCDASKVRVTEISTKLGITFIIIGTIGW